MTPKADKLNRVQSKKFDVTKLKGLRGNLCQPAAPTKEEKGMYKKITPVVAAVLATGMILSGPVSAAPKEEHKPPANEKGNQNQKQNQAEEKGQKENKGQTQELKSIDKQLDKIEDKISHYTDKLSSITESNDTEEAEEDAVEEIEEETEDALEEGLEEQEESKEENDEGIEEEATEELNDEPAASDDTTVEGQIPSEAVEESVDEKAEEGVIESLAESTETVEEDLSEELTEENPETVEEDPGESADQTEEESTEQAANEEGEGVEQNDDQSGEQTEEVLEEENETESEEADDDDELTDEEIEEEVENVEKELQNNQGYAGKFKALQNRLNAVAKRLDELSAKGVDSAVLTERYNRVMELHNAVAEAAATIMQIEDKVKETIENDDKVIEEAPADDVPLTKEWNIKFSGELDETTLSELDIVVINGEQGLVETAISYSAATKTVVITPLQPYKAGETYMLYIGKEISGKTGLDLKNSVKMEFTVN